MARDRSDPPRRRSGWSSGGRRRMIRVDGDSATEHPTVRVPAPPPPWEAPPPPRDAPPPPREAPARDTPPPARDTPRRPPPPTDTRPRPPWEPTRPAPWDTPGEPDTSHVERGTSRFDSPRHDPPRYERRGARHDDLPRREPPTPLPPPNSRNGEPPRPRSTGPRKLTVTRVAAWRSRQLTEEAARRFHGAAGADGADRSGLRALTYATMANYATDAAIAVALANTLFFSAATAESKSKVALYLLITVAPFALVAPVIGPLLDRLQRGRRWALALSFVGRAVLAVIMALHFDDWGLYPAALGVMVLSKSYTVLRAAVTPRVLPPTITLVTTNSRLTAFGLFAGAVFGGLAAGFGKLTGSPGALVYTAVLCVVGAWLCLRIPRWVEVTEGEVPASLREGPTGSLRQPMGRHVVVSLWGSGAIRVLTGFLTLFVAFVVKAQTEQDPRRQLLLLGIVGAAAGIGSFVGNALGARAGLAAGGAGGVGRTQRFDRSDPLVLGCVAVCVLAAVAVVVFPGILAATVCALLAALVSALSKVCLDAVIQRDLPERSRASAFGRSETVLQLAWVLGGAMGVLLPPVYWIGFVSVAAVVALGGAQAALIMRGRSLLPWIRHRGPAHPD